MLDATDPSAAHTGALMGPTHPTSARRHRSSSSVSRSSMSTPYTTYSTGIPLTSATAGIPHSHRQSVSSQHATGDLANAHQARSASVVSTPRYEEVAQYRQELEVAKRENESLKRRIRELERLIRGDGEGQRGRRAPSTQNNAANGHATADGTAGEGNTSQ
jgi:hypothetical protein